MPENRDRGEACASSPLTPPGVPARHRAVPINKRFAKQDRRLRGSPLARPGGCADSTTLSARRRLFGRCPRCLCWRTPSSGFPRGWLPPPPSPLALAPRRASLLPPTILTPPPARQLRLRPRCPDRGQPPPCPPSRVGVARVGGCLSDAPCR